MNTTEKAMWALRIGIFGTFLGHGVFALMVKQSWIPYFTALGFSESFAITALPLIGLMDMAVGISVLVKPHKYMLYFAVFWGFWTALVRPLTGEPIWDFVERWANWAAPLALIFLMYKKKK